MDLSIYDHFLKKFYITEHQFLMVFNFFLEKKTHFSIRHNFAIKFEICVVYPTKLLVIKIVLQPMYLSTLLGNSFWMISAGYYCYITFLGYSTLPNLKKSVAFLYPMVPFAIIFVLAFLANWNWTQALVRFYKTRL